MRSLYLVGPAVDVLVMGGASLALYVACRLFEGGAGGAAMGSAWEAVAALVAALNGAHFAATSYRLYRSPEAMRQFPLTAALVPVVVLAGVAASFRWPLLIAPYFIKLFLLWSPYHYSGQTIGLSALYARRAGATLEPAERTALDGFVFGTFLASVARAEVQLNRFDYLGVAYPSFGLPQWVATACLTFMALSGVAFLALAARRRPRLPWIVFVAPAAQFVWFVLGPRSDLFYPLVPLFHGAQYLFVSWFLHLQERRLEGATSTATESFRWGAWSLAGYVVLFLALPKILSLATGVTFLFATAVFTGGVQLHHFFVDGVIWRLRTPRLSKAMTATLSLALAFFLAANAHAAPALRPERVVLRTDAGDLVLALYAGAPRHADKLTGLFRARAYDGATVTKLDPTRFVAFSSAPGAKTARLPVESGGPHRAGVVAMAHQPGDPDAGETAFVILFADIPSMDGRFSAVGEIVAGRDVFEALKTATTDGDSRPARPLTIQGTDVLSRDAFEKASLRGPDLAAIGRDEASTQRRFLIVLGVLLIAAGLVLWVKGTPAWSSTGLLLSLAGYFSGFAALADLSASKPWLAVGLFAATVGVFRLMGRFER